MSGNKLSTKVFLGTFRQIFLWLLDLIDCKKGAEEIRSWATFLISTNICVIEAVLEKTMKEDSIVYTCVALKHELTSDYCNRILGC